MADTERSYADILTLFADNTTGAISPQDLRDFVVSVRPAIGEISITATAATTIATPGTYVKASGTTTLTAAIAHGFDMPANNRLRYTGTIDRHMHLAISVSYSVVGSNQTVGVAVAKNGTTVTASIIRDECASSSDVEAAALHAAVEMSENDYIEVFVTNETSTGSVTLQTMNFFALGLLV